MSARERENVCDRERERRGKMNLLFTCLCPYSMYCVYTVHKLYTLSNYI